MAAISSIIAGITAAAAVAGTATSIAASHKGGNRAPSFNADAEKKKVANQEAEANKRRVMAETDTVKTTALGNTGTTQTQKKTLLGG